MTQQINIDKGQTITLSNPTFGNITITLNEVGEFVIASDGPTVTVQQTTISSGLKQEYVGDSTHFKQTAFSNVKVNGDLIFGNISQSIRTS